MLNSIQIKNLKAFADTGKIDLRRINILIGANNAGKSTFLGAIELFFRSLSQQVLATPLAFEAMPSFTSFDSSLRRHWTKTTQRPSTITLKFERSTTSKHKKRSIGYQFDCVGQGTDDTIVVRKAEYSSDGEISTATRQTDGGPGKEKYDIRANGKPVKESDDPWFYRMIPVALMRGARNNEAFDFGEPFHHLEIVNPYRPVPRSFYVLDDPHLGTEDRSILTYLIRIWASTEPRDQVVRERIENSLASLGLSRKFEIAQVSKRIGPKVIEMRVSPTNARQKVTIADAGFGLSQVLPLAVYDARLNDGTFLAYQPEVHLHPFAQSRLADIFVASAARNNQLFIETHSPDLILRLQAKIAAGEISATDVSVLCFENKDSKANVTPVYFESAGSPTVIWPSGFLDTSLSLARELTAARIKNISAPS